VRGQVHRFQPFEGYYEAAIAVRSGEEKKSILLAIVIVLVGMAVIFVELGQPFRIFTQYIYGGVC